MKTSVSLNSAEFATIANGEVLKKNNHKNKCKAHSTVRFFALVILLTGLAITTTSYAVPTVTSMPDGKRIAGTTNTAYAWAGKSIFVWGRTEWSGSTSGNFELDFGDGTPVVSGAVTNQHNIGANHAYASAGTYFATLKVTDAAGDSDIATTRIDVIPVLDKAAQVNLAIERGLKHLYDRYLINGRTGLIRDASSSYSTAQSAASLLAFENRGHTPALDEDTSGVIDANDRAIKESREIYAQLVHKTLDYILSRLRTENTPLQQAGNPDTLANGFGITDTDAGRRPYTQGILIMALVGAGSSDGVAATIDAGSIVSTTGPANVIGRNLHDIVQDMVDWCAYSQVDISRGAARGGWRYRANDSSSDNSAAQWCPIGMDEATVQWSGISIPAFVLSENARWTTFSQHASGSFGYTSSAQIVRTDWWQTETGAGIAQLSMQGLPQSDPKVVAAHTFLDTNWGPLTNGSNLHVYGMYAVTKGLRSARDAAGNRSTINLIGTPATRDWYDAYATKLVATQTSTGKWEDTYWVRSYVMETAWAIEILTPALTGQPPVANAGGPYPSPSNMDIAINGSASFHENPARFLVTYEWDFDASDGVSFSPPDATGSLATIVGGFPDIGADYSKTITLRVTDDAGDTDTDTATVNITSGNIAPLSNAGGPYQGGVGNPIMLDGSASTDANAGEPTCGNIVRYEWDLDGNGTFETDGGASTTISNTWATPYFGFIGLRVTDDCGAAGTSSVYTEISISDVRPQGDIDGDGVSDGYQIISQSRFGRFAFDYVVKMTMINVGTGDANSVTASLQNFPGNVTVIDGDLSFGDILAGTTMQSTDTFTIRIDRRVITSDKDLKWRISYVDAAGAGTINITVPWQ